MDIVKMSESFVLKNCFWKYHSEYKKRQKICKTIFKIFKTSCKRCFSHNIRFFEPYPFVVKSSSGKNLVDVDSNKYVRLLDGSLEFDFRTCSKKCQRFSEKQIEKSWMYGTVNEQTMQTIRINFKSSSSS